LAPAQIPADATRGPIVAIGGAEDKMKERRVLRQLAQMAGGKNARIAVIPSASSIPLKVAEVYARVFTELGVESVQVFNITSRGEASEPKLIQELERATLVFFSGGDQLRLVATIGGTPLAQSIRRMNARGVPVAGTSAGAGVLCQHMIASGKSGQAIGRRMVSLAPGLGLSNRIVIDQHFSQRHRIGRLLTAVAMNPFLVGIGIDEDTAACLTADNRLSVWGRGSVTVVDGMHINYTDVHEVDGKNPIAVLGMQIHILTAGCSFDLITHNSQGPLRGSSDEEDAPDAEEGDEPDENEAPDEP
jgi:cyanophycinase